MAHKITQKTIVLPISASNYTKFMLDRKIAHKIIQDIYKKTPDLFPVSMSCGYCLNGKTKLSKKSGVKMRRIKIDSSVYQIRPSYLLSYQKEKVSLASKGLFLYKFGVPFWALAHVFGYNPMWWYRLFISLGEYDIVGASVYQSCDMPQDLLADEHHIYVKGVKKYVATTVGSDCFLGMAVCHKASENSLEQGYSIFKEEALKMNPNYRPDTVNTDGWKATQNAWKNLFPNIVIIECFLHAFLKIRNRATKKLAFFFDIAADKAWNCYRAETKRALGQQIRRFREWTIKNVPKSPMKEAISKLWTKKERWMKHFDNPKAKRTSNMLDRLMRLMKKHKINSQMFHGNIEATTKNFRAFALIHNFAPSSPRVWKKEAKFKSPAARLNKKIYAQNWLENLILSNSRAYFCYQHKLL